MKFKSWGSKDRKRSIPRINERFRDITYLRTRYTQKYRISFVKTRAIQVHCHINGWFPSTSSQAKTYLQTF